MEKKIKFRTPFTYEMEKGSINKEPSLFEPDQTMSIREIMERFARGLPIAEGMSKNPVYLDEEELPDLRKMDLADQEEYLRENAEKISELRQKLQEQVEVQEEVKEEKEQSVDNKE